MKDPTELESSLIAVKNPLKHEETVETGIFVRSIMKMTNLDFVYVFEKPLAANQLEKIKGSLQQVLGHYPAWAGRVQGNQVLLNNEGAAFTVQSMPKGSSIQDIPEDPPTGKPYCDIPAPKEQIEGKAPVLTVTITKFDDGWTLGVVMLHLVADAWSFAMFLKDWSDLYNSKEIEPVQYQLPGIMFQMHQTKKEADEAALTDLNWVPMPLLKQLLFKGLFRYLLPSIMKNQDPRLGSKPERLVLHYSASQLKQLKDSAATVAKTWVSTNEALMAHVWKVLAEASQLTAEQKSNIGANFAINLRSKLPGVSPRLVGNVVTSSRMEIDLNGNLEQQIHTQMRSALTEKKLLTAFMVSTRAWTEQGPCDLYITKKAGDLLLGGIPGVLSWNWQVSNPYFDVDFGSGPPLRGIPWSWNQPVTVVPSPKGGADVYIDMTSQGPVSWKRPPPKWATIGSLCGFLSMSGALLLLKSEAKRSTSLLWLTMMGLFSVEANYYARKDVEKSKQDFCDFVNANAHRGLNA
mmetsp:Transcript_43131/g.104355  ORF Transcript_43131/g.104355 Transcript_43131/m.104355 type:complete len:519 (-) Transcript_43131:528-2084(-)